MTCEIRGIDKGVIRPRHMVCPGYSAESDRCNSCHHRAVHNEALNCKAVAMLGCPDCKPVSEANE
jgi:hypothetical protein